MKIIINIIVFTTVLVPMVTFGQELDQEFLVAVKNGQVSKVNNLLDQEPKLVSMRDKDGRTPLMLASTGGHYQIVNILIENGAPLNEKDKDGWTALKLAAEGGYAEIILALINKGSCVDCIPDNWLYEDQKKMDDQTALLLAAKEGHSKAVKILLEADADVNYLAERIRKVDLNKSSSDILKEIQDYQSNAKTTIDIERDRGTSALMLAVVGDHAETVKILLEHGALKDIKNRQEQTALDIATEKGFYIIILLLQGRDVISDEEYNKQGLLLFKTKNYIEAIGKFTEAIKLNPSYAIAFFNRGTAKLVGIGDYIGAISDFTKAIEIEPAYGEAYIARRIARLRYGERESGCSDLRKAEQLGFKVQYNIIEEKCGD